MPVAQFASLVQLLPEIEQALKQRGESLPRPVYAGDGAQSNDDQDATHDQPAQSASPSKQNIETTSEEDEGDD